MIKKRKRGPRVENAHNWQSMAGDSPLEQMLNAYLTTQFILSKDVPADECLHEARKIINIVYAYGESADSGMAWDALGRNEFPATTQHITSEGDKDGR